MNTSFCGFCNSPEHVWRPNRREFLFVGLVGSLGLTLGNVLKLRAESASGKASAQSVINIFLPGGIAAQESFDPKLLAPIEYRGPLGTVKPKLEGVYFAEPLQKTAQVADRLCVVRSMTHGEADHARGTHNMFTGWRPSPAVQYPSIGSIVSHELGSRNDLPPYVCIPSQPNEFAGTGFLGSAYGPFSLGADPAERRVQSAGSEPARGRGREALCGAAADAGSRGRALQRAGEVRCAGRHGLLLPAGLRDDQLG